MLEVTERQLLVESFAARAGAGLGEEIAIVTPWPWSAGAPPQGVAAPRPGRDPQLDPNDMAGVLRRCRVLLVLGHLEEVDDRRMADLILPHVADNKSVIVFVALIFPPAVQIDQAMNNRLTSRYSQLLGLGFDEVLLDPSPEPPELSREIRISRSVLELNERRMQLMLDTEDEPVTREQLEKLRANHRRLLWETIPRALMLYFGPLNRSLIEAPCQLDRFKLLRKIESSRGTLILGVDETQTPIVVKVTDKSGVTALGELECIYREYRFLSEIIRHPHVVHCMEMLHSPTHIYLVFQLAGNTNLARVLHSEPGQRLCEAGALNMFNQVASGLACCHSRNVSHRQLSLAHIVVQRNGHERQDKYHCVIVDFHKAMMARAESTSSTVAGSLPYIAPEMAIGRAYVPHKADCWSLGAVLLEAAGGLGSMSVFLGYNEQSPEATNVAKKQLEQFAIPGSHARALAGVGAVSSERIAERLALLLQPDPDKRASTQSVCASERAQ